ncbi:hypothetical protein BO85DRAFT_384447 [Aspergillus piperis CBS 112811]|uniref:Uncharacterized protein n=1 Tax=Aspergillus piperis CBS 112811 TaxID=1448313 RepID=A0A8G1QTY5_9EURO|nr:hypothetical protein BO85DRAFT_384447 [Aspergillus piperis CBS 112811]RAH52200.1 hypothetical protein BO85DRAFT_384447 [Aspergillus piperis CBS 112811]
MGDRDTEDIAIPTETSPSSPKPPKLNKQRNSKKLSSPPSEKVALPEGDQQGAGESPPTEPTTAPTEQGGDQSNSQKQPQDTKSKMPGGDLGDLKGAGDKAGGVKNDVKEITTGGLNMNIDDPDLQWPTEEKSGSLQIRVRLNLRAKVQLNLDARVKGEVVIGLL